MTVPRHPSAGNIGRRPTAVPDAAAPTLVDPLAFPYGGDGTPVALQLGPGTDPELGARLVGGVEGRRVLLLGCGTGADAIWLARSGARTIVVDPSKERLADARAAADEAETRLELHHGDLADLAFVRADQIDLALAIYSLAGCDDLGRVFRQVHRVLRSDAALLLSLPHPATLSHAFDGPSPRMIRTDFDPTVARWVNERDQEDGEIQPHRIGDVFTTLTRSNFRVDTLLEPMSLEADASTGHWSPMGEWAPLTVVLRGRKLGL